METLLATSQVRNIGVSNFSLGQLKRLKFSSIKPTVHQIELHPYLQQDKWVKAHQVHEVAVTAYSPLGNMNPVMAMMKIPHFCSTIASWLILLTRESVLQHRWFLLGGWVGGLVLFQRARIKAGLLRISARKSVYSRVTTVWGLRSLGRNIWQDLIIQALTGACICLKDWMIRKLGDRIYRVSLDTSRSNMVLHVKFYCLFLGFFSLCRPSAGHDHRRPVLT